MIDLLSLHLGRAFVLGLALGAAAPRTSEEVVALVTRAVDHIKAVGAPAAFADFNRRDGGFLDGELYVFCNSADGVVLAHGGNPKLVGRNLTTVRDALGNHPVAEVDRIALTLGQGWHDYVWPNPATGQIQPKTSYVVRIDDNLICGSGYYPHSSP
jgi:cytochrome c